MSVSTAILIDFYFSRISETKNPFFFEILVFIFYCTKKRKNSKSISKSVKFNKNPYILRTTHKSWQVWNGLNNLDSN